MLTKSGASISISLLILFAHWISAEPMELGKLTDIPVTEWDQVVADAQSGWKSLRQSKASWRADVVSALTYVEDGKLRHEPYQYSVNQGLNCGLLETHSPTHSEIMGWNGDYAFRLFRKAEKPEHPYKIEYVGKDATLRVRVAGHTAIAFQVAEADVDQLVRSDTFSIKELARSDDGRLVSIIFSSDYKSDTLDQVINGGTFTIDMSLSGAVAEYSVRTKAASGTDWFFSKGITYVIHEGVPYPKAYTAKAGFSGAEAHIIAEGEFTNVRAADLAEEDSRLSAYGFPEPGFSNQRSTGRWRMLLVLGNIVAGLVGFAIWRKSRRRAN